MLAFLFATTKPLFKPSPSLSISPRPFLTTTTLFPRRRTRRPDTPSPTATYTPPPLEQETAPGDIPGTNLRVLRYPHPSLRAPNATVPPDEFDASLKQLSREMFLVMYASRGVGLAAPQVGVNKRVMVFNPDADPKAFLKEVVLVNPQIVAKSKKTLVEPEACLSFPGMQGCVRRHDWVKVEAQRLTGKKFKVKYDGWVARIFQHEYDHLDGVVYVDKIETEEDRQKVRPILERLVQEYNKSSYNEQAAAL